MSASEFGDWMAYYRIEPFGPERSDLGHAITACTIANANRGKNQRAFRPQEFMPNFDPPKQQSVDEMKTILNGLCHG